VTVIVRCPRSCAGLEDDDEFLRVWHPSRLASLGHSESMAAAVGIRHREDRPGKMFEVVDWSRVQAKLPLGQ
jgi:hypothetical protein